jgi:hypothetical protein
MGINRRGGCEYHAITKRDQPTGQERVFYTARPCAIDRIGATACWRDMEAN